MKKSGLHQAFAVLSVIAAFSFFSCSNSDNDEELIGGGLEANGSR